MSMVIAPRDFVKGEGNFDEFRAIFRESEEKAISQARTTWSGFTFGGVTPGDRQFGITSFRPRDVTGESGTISFVKNYTTPGSWTDIFSYAVPEDQMHVLWGIAIEDPNPIFSHVRLEVGDRRLPIINIEEARTFETPFALIVKTDKGEPFILEEEERVLIRGLQERGTSGSDQRVIPLGFELFRRKDSFITENEPSA